jgi:RNA polymerase sigma factor (sigma-70 family)
MIPADMDYQSDSSTLLDPIDRQRALTSALAHERDRIVRFCARYTGSTDAAEDLAQETLIEAWRHAERLRALDGLGFWLTAIARNVCRRWREHQQRPLVLLTTTVHSALDELADDADFEVALERQELADLLDRALGQLPPETRTTLIEKYIYERPQSEIARRLGVSEGAVELRLHRGKLALRRLLTTSLSHEAAEYGIAAQAGTRWNETRIWCPHCGRRRLLARLESGHHSFFLHCPDCSTDRLPLGHWEDPAVISGLKGYKPMLTRLATHDHQYYRQGIRDGVAPCRTCGAPTVVERLVPADLAALVGSTRGLVLRCQSCFTTRYCSPEALVCSLPEFQRFWHSHPRVHRLPLQEVEAEGQAASVTRIESLSGSDSFTVVWAHDSYQVLHLYEGESCSTR